MPGRSPGAGMGFLHMRWRQVEAMAARPLLLKDTDIKDPAGLCSSGRMHSMHSMHAAVMLDKSLHVSAVQSNGGVCAGACGC